MRVGMASVWLVNHGYEPFSRDRGSDGVLLGRAKC
jgi:hypothetical protein